ncbi:uncharacterized protein A4U43_C06F9150 [Asparagus officinalis]|uniref:Protein kinase domain-containing protein n=1 Tax=Asparagus officinalis TaxID=4686 RepID=A0A5P1ER94_ASPOF|nr:uncharacterized protein A4U43_C06F9150 [Asparagus officinalis]
MGATLPNLETVLFDGNQFEGPMPLSLSNTSRLSSINMSSNNLNGRIPLNLGRLSSLSQINLESNRLKTSDAESWEFLNFLANCSQLKMLSLHQNNLGGELPNSIVGNLVNLTILALGLNILTGVIPESIGNLTQLVNPYLTGNNLDGSIPSSLGNLQQVEELGLVSSMKYLRILYVVGNKLTGEIPSSLGDCQLLESLNNLKGNSIDRVTSALPWSNDRYLRASYLELAKATDGFSDNNLIGTESYALVYRVILHHDNTIVAVKILKLERRGATKSFTDEYEALRNIRHRYLIKILTSCSTVDKKVDDSKALVFEFMPNGNLEAWLHTENKGHSLIQRLNIAIDVADALKYLHYDCQVQVIHCDLKPSNILLDDDMVAHVGDFGLARQPTAEYGAGAQVSTSGDEYGYGIILLEMFTGIGPTDDMFKDGQNLPNFVQVMFPDRVTEVIDPVLLLQQAEGGYFNLEDDSVTDSRKVQE